jgi:hypothetical protein
MRFWLRPILDRMIVGLVPLDGDPGHREPAVLGNDFCRVVPPAPPPLRPRVDEAVWIPSTILFGPPL